MLELVATMCAGAFAGAALYISVVQHPAMTEAGTATAVRFFPGMYRRAAPMQAGLAVVGTLAGLAGGLTKAPVIFILGALLLGFVVPYTLIRIKPVNDRLLDPDLDPDAPDVPELLDRWRRMHRIRTIMSSVAFLIFAAN